MTTFVGSLSNSSIYGGKRGAIETVCWSLGDNFSKVRNSFI